MNEEKWLRTQVVSNVVIAFFTVVLAVVAYYQWHAMLDTVERTEDIARAWVVFSGINGVPTPAADYSFSFSLKFKNVGQSAALNVSRSWRYVVCDGPPSYKCASQCSHSPDPPVKQGGYGIMGPQEEFSQKIVFPPQSPDVVSALERGDKFPYFCATVEYRDIFHAPGGADICILYFSIGEEFVACPTEEHDQGR